MSPAALLLAAAALGFGPFGTPSAPVTADAYHPPAAQGARGPTGHFFEGAYWVYRHVISPIDGPRCQHRPSCSAYAMGAVRERGLLLGAALTVDRLWMGAQTSALRTLPLIYLGDRYYLYHPLAAETWWLDAREGAQTWPTPSSETR